MAVEILSQAALDYLPLLAIGMAFTQRVRTQIRRRAKGRDEITGRFLGRTGQAAHINHDQSDPDYNSKDNGFYASTLTHLINHVAEHGHNGLSIKDNESAITLLIYKFFKVTGKRKIVR